jgi:uncharacterized protein (TIGR00369 family)
VPLFDLETARRVFHSAPFVADVGIEPTRVSEGEVDASVDLAPRHLQHTGVVHAGVLTTLADHTSGAAAYTLAPAGFAVVTADMHVALLRAATGERLECTARVVKPGRQMMFTEAEVYCIRDGARQLVAKFSATMAVVEAR